MKRLFPHLHAPLLPLAVCLAAGIAIGSPFSSGLPLLLLFLTLVTVCFFIGRWPLAQSICVWTCLVVLGMLTAPGEEKRTADGEWAEAVVVSTPSDRPKTVLVKLLLPATGEERRCYFWKGARSQQLALGDNLLVCIHDGQFVSRDSWQPGGDGFNRLSHFQRLRIRALQWRGRLLQRLMQQGGDEQALAVVAAMALGDKSALSRELRDTYSATGASHILALSGLHLSIIYMLLTRLIPGRRRFWPGQVLTILAIWAFALLTGLSVSIVRAAVMLTVYSLFALGGRRQAPLGVLSFTAIVLLLTDSRSLFDIGFQLSFMAMLGILLFTPVFERWVSLPWMESHRPARWLYGLLAVSAAAQLGTAPLVAYYFGRFSTWFLLTNIIAIPAATLILYSALLTLLIPAMGSLLLWLAEALNNCLEQITKLPLASIEGLHPSILQVAMTYVAIAALGVLLSYWHPQRQTPYYT